MNIVRTFFSLLCEILDECEKAFLRSRGEYCEACDSYEVQVEIVSEEVILCPVDMFGDGGATVKTQNLITCSKCGQSHEGFNII